MNIRIKIQRSIDTAKSDVDKMKCPAATQDLKLNTKNRDAAIKEDHIQYGPLNVDEPGDYWKDIAKHWNTTEKAAKKSLCGNCVAFDISPRMKDCMPGETSDKDGELGTGLINSSGEVSFSYSDLSANTHTIQFTVEDELESSCSDSIILSVATPPNITLTSPTNGDVVTAGELVSFSGSVEDGEDLPSNIAITWNSSIDGDFSTQGATSTGVLTLNTSDLSTGLHSITVTATDSAGLTDAEIIGLRINTLPAQPTVSVLPEEIYTTSNLNAVAGNLVDDDGHSVQASYEWFKNGALTTFTSTTIQSSDTAKGEVWTVRVTPNDGYQDGPYTQRQQ